MNGVQIVCLVIEAISLIGCVAALLSLCRSMGKLRKTIRDSQRIIHETEELRSKSECRSRPHDARSPSRCDSGRPQ